MYKCSKCNLGVIVYDGNGNILPKPVKACNCNAPIVAEMSSTLEGTSTAGIGTTIRTPKVKLGQ